MAGVKKALEKIGGMKYALIVAALGLVLLLWPSGGEKQTATATEETRLEALIGRIEGVGEVHLLLSEQGAAVVCTGADDAAVRLRICKALQCYTGLGSDRIQIFKLKSN